jgi:hypothetical protein
MLPESSVLRSKSQVVFVSGVVAMDVGITKSNKSHPVHFITGMLVVTISYSAVMFAVRAIVLG